MESEITLNTSIDAIKERLGKYDFLRITEDERGLHVYNIIMQADLLLYREPIGFFGRAAYGRIIYEKDGRFLYLDKKQFDHAIRRLFDMVDDIRQGKA